MKFRTTVIPFDFIAFERWPPVTSPNASGPQGGAGGNGAGAPVPVSVAPVVRRDFPIILTGLGTVQAYNTVTLKTRVDGQIMAVYFREGQDVRKGPVAGADRSAPLRSCAGDGEGKPGARPGATEYGKGKPGALQGVAGRWRGRAAGLRYAGGIGRAVCRHGSGGPGGDRQR